MALLPKSRTARKRLMVVGVAGGVLAVAAGLVFLGLGDAVSFFYTPSQAAKAHPPAGRTIQLGGFVRPGSLVKSTNGQVEFVVTDCGAAEERVSYKGELPDLFREGQGVVAKGSFNALGQFTASEVLAKHDERYMPRELTKSLKASGEWRGDQPAGSAAQGGEPPPAYLKACKATSTGVTKS